MANINIQDSIISSSADYGIYHGLSKVAQVKSNGLIISASSS